MAVDGREGGKFKLAMVSKPTSPHDTSLCNPITLASDKFRNSASSAVVSHSRLLFPKF